jgi:hypothetical protein
MDLKGHLSMMRSRARFFLMTFLLFLSLVGLSEAALKGTPVLYPPVPLTHATDCTTGITTAYQDQMCVDLDDGKVWICKTPGAGGATDVADNPLCNQPSEWQQVAPAAGGYTQIQDEGLVVTGRTALNFGGTGVSCVDNAGQARTDCTIAGGGAGGNEKTPAVSAATTGNISNLANPGTSTFDGTPLAVTTPRQRLLIWQQTAASQNGIYDFNGSGVPLTRSADADQDSEFTTNFQVFNQAATGTYAQRTFRLANTGAVSIGSSNITFIIASYGPGTEVLTNKNVNSGYMGLTALGRGPWNRMTQPAIHPNLSATDTINILSLNGGAGANVIGLQSGIAGNVLLTTANPRINGCTAGNDRVRILLVGLSPTQTVTIPNGQGVLLAGNTGTATVGIAPGGNPVEFVCNGSTLTWEQMGAAGQTFPLNPNVAIYACGDARNPVFDGSAGNKWEFCLDVSNNPTMKAFCGGGACDSTVQLAVGKVHCVKKHDGSNLFCVNNDSGLVTGTLSKVPIMGNDNGTITACGGQFYHSPATRTSSVDLANAEQVFPGAYTFGRFHMRLASPLPAGHSLVFTYVKNGVSQPLTCTIAAGGQTCTDTTHTFSVVAGDLVALRSNCSGGTDPVSWFSFGMETQ